MLPSFSVIRHQDYGNKQLSSHPLMGSSRAILKGGEHYLLTEIDTLSSLCALPCIYLGIQYWENSTLPSWRAITRKQSGQASWTWLMYGWGFADQTSGYSFGVKRLPVFRLVHVLTLMGVCAYASRTGGCNSCRLCRWGKLSLSSWAASKCGLRGEPRCWGQSDDQVRQAQVYRHLRGVIGSYSGGPAETRNSFIRGS